MAVGGDAGRGDHRVREDAQVDPDLAARRIQGDARHRTVARRPAPERGDLLVQVGAEPRHLRRRDAAVGARGLDQVVDLAGADAVEVRPASPRRTGLVRSGGRPPSSAGRASRCVASGSAAPDSPRSSPASALALSGADIGALMRPSADHRGRLRVDRRSLQELPSSSSPTTARRGWWPRSAQGECLGWVLSPAGRRRSSSAGRSPSWR